MNFNSRFRDKNIILMTSTQFLLFQQLFIQFEILNEENILEFIVHFLRN